MEKKQKSSILIARAVKQNQLALFLVNLRAPMMSTIIPRMIKAVPRPEPQVSYG
jgi:hypothetical protein